ncbi:MAG: sugar ABC transporter ATP-binding protein [Actinobacteria bacterium]|nr:sugar ABC transporter ATP-binding protein [Actinomycetota bacterium]
MTTNFEELKNHNNIMISMEGIVKVFPGVVALDHVDFFVKKGEIHGLVGENGAGKSTLLKILSGLYEKDAGRILIEGEEIQNLNVSNAINHGIRMLAQNPEILPSLSVAENIFIESLPLKNGLINNKKLNDLATQALSRIDMKLDPRRKMETLTFLQQKIVLIAKALWYGVKILILDEPTASLTFYETRLLFDHIKELNKMGTSIIYVSHYLEEVFEICNRVTVFREGKNIATEKIENIDISQLVRYMIGKDVDLFQPLSHKPQDKVLEAFNISKKGKYSDVSFYVKRGEIISLSGLKGSGKEDVVSGLFGFHKIDSGKIYIDGMEITKVSCDVVFKKGILLLPADRLVNGLFLNLTVLKNISICSLDIIKNKMGMVSANNEVGLAKKYKDMLSIRTSSINQEAQFLSGGNQQKVVLAKVLAANPKVLILHEPTAGIDIGSKAEIHAIIEDLARHGIGIIILTYDISEVLNMCDRVYVLHKGLIIKEMIRNSAEFNKNNLTLLMEGKGYEKNSNERTI